MGEYIFDKNKYGATPIVNYTHNGRRRNFSGKWATDKQHKYAEDMLNRCKELGIDISFIEADTSTKDGCRNIINTTRTLLRKNGYSTRGGKITTYNLNDEETVTDRGCNK